MSNELKKIRYNRFMLSSHLWLSRVLVPHNYNVHKPGSQQFKVSSFWSTFYSVVGFIAHEYPSHKRLLISHTNTPILQTITDYHADKNQQRITKTWLNSRFSPVKFERVIVCKKPKNALFQGLFQSFGVQIVSIFMSFATIKTSIVYHDKRGFFVLFGRKIGEI